MMILELCQLHSFEALMVTLPFPPPPKYAPLDLISYWTTLKVNEGRCIRL